MPRAYYVPFDAVAVSAAQDLFEFLPADDKPIRLLEVHVAAVDSETAEQLRFQVKRLGATVTSGSGGASVTPVPADSNDAAAGFTAERNNTTQASTGGTSSTIVSEGADLRAGFHFSCSAEDAPRAVHGEALVVSLPSAPAVSVNLSGWAKVIEGA